MLLKHGKHTSTDDLNYQAMAKFFFVGAVPVKVFYRW
jgi:hypothetical protein